MNEELITQVEELGLSNKEARIYIANLMLGPAGVQQIADASGIKRVTTYVILESLVALGLVSQTSKAKKTLFNAEAPENLMSLLEKREQSLAEQKQQLKDLLPDLSKLRALPRDIPTVKFYEGSDGIQTINKMFFSEIQKAEIVESRGISDLDRLYRHFPYIEDLGANPERIRSGASSKFIYTSTKGAIMKKGDPANNRKSRFVPAKNFNLGCDISIAGDLVALLSLDETNPIGITIKSTQIADGMRSVFDLAWEAAEKYN